MVIWEDSLLLDGVLNAVLDLVRGLLRLEVYQTASVLPVFQQMDGGAVKVAAQLPGGDRLRPVWREVGQPPPGSP